MYVVRYIINNIYVLSQNYSPKSSSFSKTQVYFSEFWLPYFLTAFFFCNCCLWPGSSLTWTLLSGLTSHFIKSQAKTRELTMQQFWSDTFSRAAVRHAELVFPSVGHKHHFSVLSSQTILRFCSKKKKMLLVETRLSQLTESGWPFPAGCKSDGWFCRNLSSTWLPKKTFWAQTGNSLSPQGYNIWHQKSLTPERLTVTLWWTE